MGLRNLTFPTVEVQTSGGSLVVRGLSLDHILGLFYRYREPVTALYSAAMARGRSGEQASYDDVTVIGIKMIGAAPLIVAEIIAIASGSNPEDDAGFAGDIGIVRGLSVAEQLDALEKIAGQTFTSEMPPGKLFALVIQAMQAGTSAMAKSLPGEAAVKI